jgi:hypothetical protein
MFIEFGWVMNTYISERYTVKRSSLKINNFMHPNKELQKLAEKYYRLMSLKEPFDFELNQLEEILELATIDEELNDLLINIDEQIAIQAGLVSDEFVSKPQPSSLASFNIKRYFFQQTKILVNISLISLMSMGGLLLIKQCDSIHVKLTYNPSLNYHVVPVPVSEKDATQNTVSGKSEASETQEQSISTGKHHRLENIISLERRQLEYESKQKRLEKQQIIYQALQLNFEKKQKQAEAKNLYEQAQEYMRQAQVYKQKSKQLLFLSKQYEMKAEESLSMANGI